MIATLLALLLAPTASAQVDIASVFAEQAAAPGSPLAHPGARVDLWGVAGLTLPEGMLGTQLHGGFIVEAADRSWRVRVENLKKKSPGPASTEKAPVEYATMDKNEAYGGIKPEEEEYQTPVSTARIDHATTVLRLVGEASEREDDGKVKKVVKQLAEALREPAKPAELSLPEAMAGTRLTLATAPEHGHRIDLCPGGKAHYAYDGNKPIGGAVTVSESSQDAAGTWGATESELHLAWGDGTTWVLARGEGVVGYDAAPSADCK